MSSAAFELQKSIYTTLTGDGTLMGMISGVFDNVPDNQAFPYIAIGDDTLGDWSTFARLGQQATLTLHVYAQAEGKKVVKDILSRMDTLLNRANFAISGFALIGIVREFEETLVEQDGLTYHGVQRYRALIST